MSGGDIGENLSESTTNVCGAEVNRDIRDTRAVSDVVPVCDKNTHHANSGHESPGILTAGSHLISDESHRSGDGAQIVETDNEDARKLGGAPLPQQLMHDGGGGSLHVTNGSQVSTNSTPTSVLLDIDDEFQTELCKLWDMSTNQDVCEFLKEYQAVKLLCSVIDKTKAPRVAEICVGILANMACLDQICDAVFIPKYVELFVLLLNTRDGPTLAETTRLLYTGLSNPRITQKVFDVINQEPNFLPNLIFILTSSTNVSLLRNTGELLDTLLDQYLPQLLDWVDESLVHAMLEAVHQIRSYNEDISSYIHLFQILSTIDRGVEALECHAERLQGILQKFLNYICEFDAGGIEGREATLAAVLAVYNILFTCSPDVATSCLESEEFIDSILKIADSFKSVQSLIEPQCNDDQPSLDKSGLATLTAADPTQRTTDADPDRISPNISEEKAHYNKDPTSSLHGDCVSPQSGKVVCSNDDVSSDPTNDHTAVNNKKDLNILSDVLTGFVQDIFSRVPLTFLDKENSDVSPHSFLTYLNKESVSRRVSGVIRLLKRADANVLLKLQSEAEYHDLALLHRVITEDIT